VFSNRLSLDSLFHSSRKEERDSADVLLVGLDNGTLHLSIYDSFELGKFHASQHQQQLLKHASHPYSSTHALLMQEKKHNDTVLSFVPMDLRLITDTGRYLSLIASKSTQLQNLLRYILATQVQIYNEFKATHDLPGKFIRNIEESLQEKNSCSFVNAAYHLAATGNCYEAMKEWLVDELGDRVS
jgi:anaphase-promoting complex subunit 4